MITKIWTWLTDPMNWTGTTGIPNRLIEHLQYCAISLLIASLIAIPFGLYIGHTGKGRIWGVQLANGMRSVPTLGLLFVTVLLISPHLNSNWAFLGPSIAVLVLLAIPPILTGTYTGISSLDPATRDAARGMGMTPMHILWRVELPNALPLLFSGLRSAALQVIATATIAATVSVGGLGRFLIDGQAFRDFAMMSGGAILVAGLALAVDLSLIAVERLVVSPGIRTRNRQKT
ncbi:ABC transporter permease [Dermatophilus congolensis]|uniref:Putative osmoprotectant uptake system permease protein yehW n=1 Tax=Dermatophilus congolensis TaxID=1863 RepID=A0A239V7N9_9MICO|nr:ABC transporter permease [Dermatophilus congolensis]MBO3130455.1 ABC transporter permease [Dermatophilus congolensis]MBO3130915.1 ABC transporter permease [Dermatophilus congolensis]MBO3134926.1 ABC transporter permease [Dermatophilus congolensis]MBO3137166.1 ABC transporter permease [Dermatophilus congolensis]MBO3139409.1 ABC transporter permease [Dermatophilus congolensis]